SCGGRVASLSRHQRKAARVLPEPVGARRRVCSPRETASQPSSWARVGSAKVSRNQARAAGPKRSRAEVGILDFGFWILDWARGGTAGVSWVSVAGPSRAVMRDIVPEHAEAEQAF